MSRGWRLAARVLLGLPALLLAAAGWFDAYFADYVDDIDRSMRWLLARGQAEHIDIKLAPAWGRVDPFAGL